MAAPSACTVDGSLTIFRMMAAGCNRGTAMKPTVWFLPMLLLGTAAYAAPPLWQQNRTYEALSNTAMSITGSVSAVAVSGAVSAIVVNSNAIAYVEGDVLKADNLTVKAVSEYPLCLAATLAVSGGIVGGGASVAPATDR